MSEARKAREAMRKAMEEAMAWHCSYILKISPEVRVARRGELRYANRVSRVPCARDVVWEIYAKADPHTRRLSCAEHLKRLRSLMGEHTVVWVGGGMEPPTDIRR